MLTRYLVITPTAAASTAPQHGHSAVLLVPQLAAPGRLGRSSTAFSCHRLLWRPSRATACFSWPPGMRGFGPGLLYHSMLRVLPWWRHSLLPLAAWGARLRARAAPRIPAARLHQSAVLLDSMARAPPWQCPRLAPAPSQGSGWLDTLPGRAQATGYLATASGARASRLQSRSFHGVWPFRHDAAAVPYP